MTAASRFPALVVAITCFACAIEDVSTTGPTISVSDDIVAPLLSCPDSTLLDELTVTWSTSDSGAWFELQESSTTDFASAAVAYSGTDTMVALAGKELGRVLHYRVRAIIGTHASRWSSPDSTVLVLLGWRLRPSGTSLVLRSVKMFDSLRAIIVGDHGTILRTENGGESWTTIPNPITSSIYSVDFFDSSTGYCVGAGGVVLKSSDGGLSWTQQQSGTTATLNAVVALTRNRAAIVGGIEGISNTVHNTIALSTADGGVHWNKQVFGFYGMGHFFSFKDVAFADPLTGIAIGEGHPIGTYPFFYVTTDGGATWQSRSYSGTGSEYCIVFPSTDDCLLSRWDGAPALYRSTDHGISWSRGGNPPGSILDMTFPGPTRGFAIVDIGRLFRTMDGGNTWQAQRVPITPLFHAVDFSDAQNGIVVGDAGYVLTTRSGGE